MTDSTRSLNAQRVLVMEDDTALQAPLERLIQTVSPGAQVRWVTSAEEALVHIRGQITRKERAFDLIIADIFLEGSITGLDFWNTCQVLSPDVPLLITSSMSLDSFFKSIGRDAIAPPFLAKPFKLGECRQILESLLRSHSEHAA